jgi:hypothetical protein
VERIGEAVSHYVENQRDLMLDPLSVLITVAVVLIVLVLRLTGRRKSTRQRIAEMEDADFPEDEVPPRPESDRER